MGLLKDAGDSLLRFGEKVVNKTEVYTNLAKLNLDIRKMQDDIAECEKRMGQIITEKNDKGELTIDIASDTAIQEQLEKIKTLKNNMEEKKQEKEAIRVSSQESTEPADKDTTT